MENFAHYVLSNVDPPNLVLLAPAEDNWLISKAKQLSLIHI